MDQEKLDQVLDAIDDEIRRKFPGETQINHSEVNQSIEEPHIKHTNTGSGDTNISINNTADVTYTSRSMETYNDIEELAKLASLIMEGPEENEGEIKRILQSGKNLFTRTKDLELITELLSSVL